MKLLFYTLHRILILLLVLFLLYWMMAVGSGHHIPASTNWSIGISIVVTIVLLALNYFLERKYSSKSIGKELEALISEVAALGLSDQDAWYAEDFLTHNEFTLGFEHLVSQLHEYDIPISTDFYLHIEKVGKALEVSDDKYVFIRSLIKD